MEAFQEKSHGLSPQSVGIGACFDAFTHLPLPADELRISKELC